LTGRLQTAIGLARYAYSEEAFRGKQPDMPRLVCGLGEPGLQLVALAKIPSLIVCTKRHPSLGPRHELWIAFGGTPILDSRDYYWSRDLDSDLVPYRPDGQHVHDALDRMQHRVAESQPGTESVIHSATHYTLKCVVATATLPPVATGDVVEMKSWWMLSAVEDMRNWRVHRGFWRLAMDALHEHLEDCQGAELGPSCQMEQSGSAINLEGRRDLGRLLADYASLQEEESAALRIFVVGHSSGGSMAILIAMHLLVQGICSDVVCITFGAVMPVNKHAAEALSQPIEGRPELSSR
jgi:hypothetical protein